MPVLRRSSGPPNVDRFKALSEELTRELNSPKEFGQPIVDEETFPRTGLKGVTVLWERWGGLTDPERTGVILEAYEQAYGAKEKERVAFAVGLTVPEATEVGKLPYTIMPSLRRTDAISQEQVRRAVTDMGGEILENSDFPAVLRFATLADAEACRRKLIERLPDTDAIWNIAQEQQRPSWAQ